MTFLVTVSTLLLITGGCRAQDTPLKKPQIYSLHINSDIHYRFATTKVTSRIKNPGDQSREALFDVTLPNEAFITNLTIEIDGNITVGEIKEKEEAKAQYVAARERGESAGYIGTKHRETNKFVLAISVAPLSKISFNLTYQELLKRKLGYYEQVIFIDPGQTVEDLSVTVSIRESRNITRLSVPSLTNDVGDSVLDVDNVVVISRPDQTSAIVKYSPSLGEQALQSEVGIAGRFVVQYDVERAMDIGDVMMVNGYFVHFFAPEGLQPVPNDVLFILDVSGSMQGNKMLQLTQAMLSNLDQLSPQDRFNLMTFSSNVKLWRESMASVGDEDSMEDAKRFIRGLRATGWTNIDKALTEGIEFLVEQFPESTESRAPLIVFLTDGEPTNGETNTDAILRNVKRGNEGNIPIFTLAFGKGADWGFVKKLALQNNGFGRKIYEASDAALQIMGFYNEISVTLLSNLTFNYLDVETSNVTQTHFSNYFNGSEIIICGFLPSERAMMNAEVSIKNTAGMTTVVLSGEIDEFDMGVGENLTDTGDFEEMTEKMWAYLTIKQLLEKMDATDRPGDEKQYKQEILKLSLQYGFVTPLTSMVVTQDMYAVPSDPAPEVEQFDDYSAQIRPNIQPPHRPMFSQGNRMFNYHARHQPHPVGYADTRMDIVSLPIVNQQAGGRDLSMHVPVLPSVSSKSRVDKSRQVGVVKNDDGQYDDNGVIPGGGPVRRGIDFKGIRKTKKKNKKNKQNKGKKVRGDWRFPLLVKDPSMLYGVCYNLFEHKLRNGPATYLLHTSTNKDVQVRALISTKSRSTKKKIGCIRKIDITSPVGHIIIDPSSINSVMTANSSFFTLTNEPGRSVTIEIEHVKLNVYYSRLDNEFYITVYKTPAAVWNGGLLGQILPQDFSLKEEHRKAGKNAVYQLEIRKKVYSARLRKLADTMGPVKHCYALKKKENKVYNMADERD